MKLTLQLVVVVLNAPTKFRDNLFKFTLYTIIIYKVGDKRCHLRRHALFQYNFFQEIRTPTENKLLVICLLCFLSRSSSFSVNYPRRPLH